MIHKNMLLTVSWEVPNDLVSIKRKGKKYVLVYSPRLLLVLYVAVARNLTIVMPYIGHPDRVTVADSEVSWKVVPPPWLLSLMSTDARAFFFLPIILTNYVFLKTEANSFLIRGSPVTDNRLISKGLWICELWEEWICELWEELKCLPRAHLWDSLDQPTLKSPCGTESTKGRQLFRINTRWNFIN